jgi:tRNA-specific 2-thiouridylase
MTKRVILGLSGGVDSAVAAVLLQDEGYDVHALHMTNWEDDEGYCTAAEDLQDARRICEQLDVPLHHANFSRQYRDQVFAYFLDEYRKGRTPNPDVLCNREIKFGVFRDYAKRLGGDLLATGHYARSAVVDGVGALFKGEDPNKDQSYFLHAVGHDALERSLFPVGELEKPAVRELAAEAGFVTHDKKDSTGICFIGERRFSDFLKRYLPAQPGPIVSLEGEHLGTHQGLMYHTIGQRQGLGIGGMANHSEAPWYVAGKDLANNRLLVVQGNDHPALFADRLSTGPIFWIAGESPSLPLRCTAKVRYRQPDQKCRVEALGEGRVSVHFDSPQRAVTPGQSVVFYDGERCLGGGVIETSSDAALAA